jgi:pilus assembly protein CpaB
MKLSINRNFALIGIAVALGMGAVYLSNKVIRDKIAQIEEESRQGKKLVKVVVPKKDLDRGEALVGETLAIREVPQEFVSHLAVKPEQVDEFLSQRLSSSIKRGETLTLMHTEGLGARVFSAALKKGLRALTFEVDEVNSISGMLRPGDRIDLLLTAKASPTSNSDITFPMLSDVVVIATGQMVTKQDPADGRERTFSTITLEVLPEDAQRIVVAKSSGKLTAVLRNPDDRLANRARPLTIADVVGGSNGTGQGRAIEFIVGGGGGPLPVSMMASLAPPKDPSNAPRGVESARTASNRASPAPATGIVFPGQAAVNNSSTNVGPATGATGRPPLSAPLMPGNNSN